MKIGLIVPGFSADEQDWCIPALLDHVAALAAQVEVHVFTLRWPERGGTYQVYGATVHALDGRKHLGVRALALWRKAVETIAAEHRRGPFDALHAFWLDEPGWVAAWAARRLSVRLVLSLAGGELSRMPDINYGLLLWPGRGRLVRAAARQANALTAGSRYYVERAEAYFNAHGLARAVQLAPLGVDLTRFVPQSLLAGNQRVVSVGSLTAVKGQRLLVRAFRRVSAALPDAELLIAGEGALRAELQTLAAGLPLRFAGGVPHSQLPAWYAGGALFAQGSRHEAQGMAVLEAAACGLAVVGTPVGVLPEIGRAAAGEAELAEVLVDLLSDGVKRRALAEAGLAAVREQFGLVKTVARFAALYAGGDQRTNSSGPERGDTPAGPVRSRD